MVRGHLEARECGIHFIVGSEILLTTAGGNPHARLVQLAQDRRGYGNLCELITLARRRSPKGTYLSLVADVEGKAAKAPHLAGMPGCLALLPPDRHATVESLFASGSATIHRDLRRSGRDTRLAQYCSGGQKADS